MPTRGNLNTARSNSSSGKKTLSPTVRQAARASQMNKSKGKGGGNGRKGKGKGKQKKVIGHRMERMAPPGGRTTINLGGYGDESTDASSAMDSPSSTDVHVPRYADGQMDHFGEGGGRGNGAKPKKRAPEMERLALQRPKTSAPTNKINFGGSGHEYSAYNPYATSGNVLTIDDLPTEGLMITTPRGVPLKDCVNATRREIDNAAARWKAPDQTRIGGNAVRSARQLRNSVNAGDASTASATHSSPGNEFGSGARRIQPPGGNSTFKF